MLLDADGDGLADATEAALGLDPFLFSTGGSGLPDGWLYLHLLPLFDPEIGLADGDDDGLTNAEEFAAGTDPTKKDTDGDGSPDGSDAHPGDGLRSADIPVRYFGVLDLASSTGVTDPVQLITIDDSGQVAFNTQADTSADESTTRVVVWKDGAVIQDQSYLTSHAVDPPPFTEAVLTHTIYTVRLHKGPRKRQRRSILQPRVARRALPWVSRPKKRQP